MTRTLPLLIVAAAALAACDTSDHTIIAGPGADEPEVVSNEPVVLPPAIAASKSYRCKDNSLVFVDWLSDGTARVKQDRKEIGTTVTPAAEDSPLKGDPKSATITYNGKSCHV